MKIMEEMKYVSGLKPEYCNAQRVDTFGAIKTEGKKDLGHFGFGSFPSGPLAIFGKNLLQKDSESLATNRSRCYCGGSDFG